MTRAERQALRARFGYACGYCGVSESSVGSELTVDHFQPLSAQGTDLVQNWVYACFACNFFKSDWWNPSPTERVLHPLHDPLDQHLRESRNGTLEALTEIGQFHITLLHLNREELINHRRWRRQIAEDQQQIQLLEEQVRAMAAHLDSLEQALKEIS